MTQAGVPQVDPFSVALRVGACVTILGVALALVGGSVFFLGGALALWTLGRAVDRRASLDVIVFGTAAVAAAIGVAALRWGTSNLVDLRGVQAVLGSTLQVGPTRTAIGCSMAAGGAILALSSLLSTPEPRKRSGWFAVGVEGVVVGLVLTTVFWGPELPTGVAGSEIAPELARWIGIPLGVGIVAGSGAWLQVRKPVLRRFILGFGIVVVAAGAGLVGSGL